MAASETVRLRLQFDYPPPATPHCTVFWLLVDLNRCRVVTDLISLIRQRFGFSCGALLGLYLEGGLLPPTESARLVRDNDCLRVKLEEREIPENSVVVSNGDDAYLSPRKAKKRAFKLEENEEIELDYTYSKKHWKRQEKNPSSEKALDLEPKAVTDKTGRKKSKRKNKTICGSVDGDDEDTKRKLLKKKEKCEYKKQIKNPRCPKVQAIKEWALQKCPPKAAARNSLVKARRKGGASMRTKDSPSSSSSDSESCHESTSDGLSNVGKTTEKLSANILKEKPSTKNAATKPAAKAALPTIPSKGKTARASSSSSDSSSESDDQCVVSQSTPDGVAGLKIGLFAGRGCPGPGLSPQTPSAGGWKFPVSDGSKQAPGASLPTSIGRGWGRGEDLLSWKGARGRGMRGRGRGRGHTVSCILNTNPEFQKQQQLNEIVTNSSTIIQNPVEIPKKDYSLLPLLAAAPQVGEKIAFKLLELTSDYSPDVSDYKEGKILSHNPETQQVDIEILSSLPDLKEPGKFDLVYHNENGTEVVEYAVTQEKTAAKYWDYKPAQPYLDSLFFKITVFWRELIDPRLIIDSPSNTSSTELVRLSTS